MYAEAQIRQKLIDSAFSSMEAEELLLKIADDAEHYGGDAPMRAAYFASQFPSTFLATHEPKLLALLTTVNGYSGHIALALGRTKSPRGKAVLLSELGDGSRFDAWLLKKGLAEYEWASRWRTDMKKPAKNTICLWYDGDAEEAARFYAKTFPDSSVGAVHLAPGDFPSGKKGAVLMVEFTVMGIPCLGLNGGPAFKHNEAFSFQVATADQAETDRYWNAIVGNGGEESACGWCKDKWGLSWQITPIALTKAVTDPDRAAAKRAFDAMMDMRKIDIAAIEAARRG